MNYIEKITSANAELVTYLQQNPNLIYVVLAQVLMKVIFYPIALYQAAKRKQVAWFVVLFICLFLLNDFGLLPILYLIFTQYQDKQSKRKSPSKNSRKTKT